MCKINHSVVISTGLCIFQGFPSNFLLVDVKAKYDVQVFWSISNPMDVGVNLTYTVSIFTVFVIIIMYCN